MRNAQAESAATIYDAARCCLTVRIEDVQPGDRVELILGSGPGALLAVVDGRTAEVRLLLAALRLTRQVADRDRPAAVVVRQAVAGAVPAFRQPTGALQVVMK